MKIQTMEKAENGIEVKAGKEKEAAPYTIAALIRKASEAGRLISESDILHEAAGQHLIPPDAPDTAAEIASILEKLD